MVVYHLLSLAPPSDSPAKPTLTVVRANTTSIYLSWEEPEDNNAPILMYRITLERVDGEIDALFFTVNTTELTVTGQTPFTNYSVQVVAVNSIGPSPPSVLTVMTAEGSEPTTLLHHATETIHTFIICIIHVMFYMHCVYQAGIHITAGM